MKSARTRLVTLTILLMAGATAFAETKHNGTKPAPEREVRRIAFENHQQAERFVDALDYLMECRGRRSRLDLTVVDDGAVEIAGPRHLVHHLAALIGSDDAPQREKRAARGQAQPARKHEGPASRRRDREAEFQVRVFNLSHAHAGSLVQLVQVLHVGSPKPWAVVHDDRTNTIIVKGTPEMVEMAEALIRQLDRPAAATESAAVTRLIPLSHADARTLAEVVSRVSRRTFREVEIVPDVWTNTLVLAGPREQVSQAASLIRNLDVRPAAKSKAAAKPKGAPGKGKGPAKPKPAPDVSTIKKAHPDAPQARGAKAKDKQAKTEGKTQQRKEKKQQKESKSKKQDKKNKPAGHATELPVTDA